MDFDFTDEQLQLQDACRRWVDKAYPFTRRQQIACWPKDLESAASVQPQSGGFSRAAYQEMAELGLTGLLVPESHGGLGMGPVEAMVVMESLGRGLVLEPLAQSLIASQVLAEFAPPALQSAWLPRIVSGSALVVLAHQEKAARFRPNQCQGPVLVPFSVPNQAAAQQIRAQAAIKSIAPAGDCADAFIVPSLWDGKLALALIERRTPGVRIVSAYATIDGTRAADIAFDDCTATLITTDGAAALALAFDTGIAAACAEAVGVMDSLFALTVDYLNTRRQFGVAISTFQALRHRVADMKMQLELGRSMAYYAALKMGAAPAERSLALSRAKVQLGASMRFVGQQAVQLHGGIAMTDEYIASHYFKKLTQLELTFGDSAHHLGQVSRQMQDSASVFA